MGLFEEISYWIAFNLYLLAWAAILGGVVFKANRLIRSSTLLALLGLLSHALSMVVRWQAIGHPPLFGSYENSQAAAWCIVAFTVVVITRYKPLWFLGAATYLWSPVLLLWGLRFPTRHIPLTISERSLFVDFHVIFAWLAFCSFFIAWGLALCQVFGKTRILARLNNSLALEGDMFRELLFRFLAFGFINFTIMLALGSVYEYFLFGKWWQWDIVETVSLVTWLLYGLTIHCLLFYRRLEKLAVSLTLLAPAGLLGAFFGIVLATRSGSFHTFDLMF